MNQSTEVQLPVGIEPPAVQFPHFPDRVHAVVWRNWHLVEPQRIAQTVGATVEQIEAMASSMGLPPAMPIPADYHERAFITVIRRNWHLLPYEQLLTLLDMSAERLGFVLREDDFLFLKLGGSKPKCEPVKYSAPDAEAQRRAARIKEVVEQHFGDALGDRGEPRFDFVRQLSEMPQTPSPLKGEGRGEGDDAGSTPSPGLWPTRARGGRDQLRYIYSYFAAFGDPLMDGALDPYPDGLLARLAALGVNGVWLHVVLRQLAPGGAEFPEFGEGHEQRLANLRRLVDRAGRFGIRVYLYMNEPRAMPASFFEHRPDMAGVHEDLSDHEDISGVGSLGHIAMCTSSPKVRKWLGDSLTHLFTEVPNLGGVFTITASENLTNCACRSTHAQCPRCCTRTDVEIITEVVAVIEEGVHRGNPDADVIVWDWGWAGHGDTAPFIERLPDSVWFMSCSEWRLPIERGGVKSDINEYSISAVGPGPRASRHWQLCKERGLKTVAKVQFNSTWEMSAGPFLPAMDLVAEHCANLKAANVDGLMLSWSVGGYPSPNLQIAQHFAEQDDATVDGVLDAIAAERYGPAAASHVRKAWSRFSEAFRQFPFSITVVYNAPLQSGPANLLYGEPTGYPASMVGIAYDDVDGWRGPYPAEVFAEQLEKVAAGWADGLPLFEQAVDLTDGTRHDQAARDLGVARAAQLHFASVANQVRFVLGRDALRGDKLTADQQTSQHAELTRLLETEITLARQLFGLAQQDSRIGFEASNHYYYVPFDLVEKVINCAYLKEQLAGR